MKPMKTNIMRRVYMSYALSFVEQPMLWYGAVLGGAVALFGRWTHVASIVDNTMARPLLQMPEYLMNAFLAAVARGELGTVLVVLTIASMSALIIWQLAHIRVWHTLRPV